MLFGTYQININTCTIWYQGKTAVEISRIMSVYRNLWSPFSSNRAVSLIASGGVVGLLTQQYATTSKNVTTTTHLLANNSTPTSSTKNQANENIEKRFGHNFYKPKYPYPEWDNDWDNFQIRSDGADVSSSKTVRHILLVRHGQYEQGSSDDNNRILTEVGQRQARLTGQRLAAMMNISSSNESGSKGSDVTTFSGPCYIKSLHVSNMTRAKETAKLIVEELNRSGHDVNVLEPDILLNEGLPAPIIPHRPDVGTPQKLEKEIHENHDRIEEAFQKYFYRTVPTPMMDVVSASASSLSSSDAVVDHEFAVIVCHANVIRYFVMRALQLPPEAWLRLSLFNCSITYLIVQPNNGYVTARLIGDTGHIPYEETTFSGSYGYNWVGPPSAAK